MTREEAIEILKNERRIYIVDGCERKLDRALDMAIEALQDNWIPVSERLPEDDKAVGIKKFIEHYKDDVPADAVKYEAGIVVDDKYGFCIGWEQCGAQETFSVGQPVYDEHGNIMGYLGIGLFSDLNYSTDRKIRIPVSFWQICLPTHHCKAGKKVFTYWQEKKRRQKARNRA